MAFRLFGRFYRLKPYLESYLTMLKKGYWSLGHTDIFVGREDGATEKGLAVPVNGSVEYISLGIGFPIASRYILDKCVSVKETSRF